MSFPTPLPAIRGYTVVKEVGSGSFGKAYLVKKASDPTKALCLKVISISRMSDRERREAMQEARLLANLKHPYIVAFRESWSEEGRLCIVMDYAENGDLHQKICKQRRTGRNFPEQQILRWFTQAVLAIKHMHERKILHRDIKSSNFFLTAEGRVRVGDFGIAKELGATDAMARTTIGTPYYLAPEICRERPYSWSADVWSLGIVLYELCALKVPYDAPNIRALVDKIVRTEAPRIPSCYSADLQNLVTSLLKKDATARPSAAEVLAHPLLQAEIRSMLAEEKAKKAAQAPAVAPAPAPVELDRRESVSEASRHPSVASRAPTPPSSARANPSPLHNVPSSARAPSPAPVQQQQPGLPRRPSNSYIPSSAYVPSAPVSARAASPYGGERNSNVYAYQQQPALQRVASNHRAPSPSLQRDASAQRVAPPAYRAASPIGLRQAAAPVPSYPYGGAYPNSARGQVPSRAASPAGSGSRNPTPIQRPSVGMGGYYGVVPQYARGM